MNEAREGIARLRDLSPAELRVELSRCCGAPRWVEAVAARAPFEGAEALLEAADAAWPTLGEEDWLAAFHAHPRIGERGPDAQRFSATRDLSAREQSGMDAASPEERRALADRNRAYEERFGFPFIVCATGRSPVEMLRELGERLGSKRAAELRRAAEEQRKITRLRLERLLRP